MMFAQTILAPQKHVQLFKESGPEERHEGKWELECDAPGGRLWSGFVMQWIRFLLRTVTDLQTNAIKLI